MKCCNEQHRNPSKILAKETKLIRQDDLKDQRRRKILEEPLLPLMIKMSVPTVIGMLVMVIYSLTDTFFVGLLNNKAMTAALGIAFSFMSLIQAIGFWFGYGSGNFMSKKLGKQEDEEAIVISAVGIVFSVATGFLICALAWTFRMELVGFMVGASSDSLFNFTVEYLKVIIIGVPFSLYSITVYSQLRLCGNVKDATVGLMMGIFANMLLDPLFMFMFDCGFVGAGYATLTGQIVASLSLTIFSRVHGNIPVSLKFSGYSKKRMYHILAGGLPNFARQAIASFALILVNKSASDFGAGVLAALTISSRIVAVAYLIVIGWGQGFQPICAMNYGAEKFERVKSAFKLSVSIGTGFLFISAVVLYIYSSQLVALMTGDEKVIYVATQMLKLQCITLPLLAYYALSSMLMQNTGRYFDSLTISISRQGLFYIPLLYLLIGLYGVWGIYLLQPVSDVFSFGLAYVILKKQRLNTT